MITCPRSCIKRNSNANCQRLSTAKISGKKLSNVAVLLWLWGLLLVQFGTVAKSEFIEVISRGMNSTSCTDLSMAFYEDKRFGHRTFEVPWTGFHGPANRVGEASNPGPALSCFDDPDACADQWSDESFDIGDLPPDIDDWDVVALGDQVVVSPSFVHPADQSLDDDQLQGWRCAEKALGASLKASQ